MPKGRGLRNLKRLAAGHRTTQTKYRALGRKRTSQGNWLSKSDSRTYGALGNQFSASRSKLVRHGAAVRKARKRSARQIAAAKKNLAGARRKRR